MDCLHTHSTQQILVECFASQSTNVSCIIVSVESPLTNMAYISVTASALAVFCGMSISMMSLGKISMWPVFLFSWSQLAWSRDNNFLFICKGWVTNVECYLFELSQIPVWLCQPFCPKRLKSINYLNTIHCLMDMNLCLLQWRCQPKWSNLFTK